MVGGVERGRVAGADLGGGARQPVGVAGGEDHLGALGAGPAGGLEADAARQAPADVEVRSAAPISPRSALSANARISEKLGNGWIVSRSTSSGTPARMASVACCSHSPASGPSA